MWPVSSRWMPGMTAPVLTAVVYGEVWTPPAAGNPNGGRLATFNVTTGGVTIDATNAIRRSCQQVTLVPIGQEPGIAVPNLDSDLLFPDGNELALYKGLAYADGSTEVATLGRFLMEDVEVYNTSKTGVYIELNGRDRGGTISRAKFTAPYSTDGIHTLDVQLQTLLNNRVPHLTYNIQPTGFIPAVMNFAIGDDPWASALALAASGGYELFPDANGVIVGRPALNPQTSPTVATYDTTAPGSILTSIQRGVVSTTVPNVIVVQGQGSGISTPFVSFWWDSDPNSPTFYNATVPVPGSNMTSLPTNQGSYPMTVEPINTQASTTQPQNDSIALAAGYATAGTIETMDFKLRDNSAHDADDVVLLYDPETTIVPKLYVLDSVKIQLDASKELEAQGRLVGLAA